MTALAVHPIGSAAQVATSPPPKGARTHTLVLGERYRVGGFKRFLLGKDYRNLWTTSVDVDVLNLDSEAAG
ncbi:MAG: hypothetical protein ACE1Z9_08675 [Acidimicrobiia bacterium]